MLPPDGAATAWLVNQLTVRDSSRFTLEVFQAVQEYHGAREKIKYCPTDESNPGLMVCFMNEIEDVTFLDDELVENGTDDPANVEVSAGSSQIPQEITIASTPQVKLIDRLDADFKEAVDDIRRQPIIGFGVEGVLIGRRGKLCWIQIRTVDKVYLFDMLFLAEGFFENGLREILEGSNIVKVAHDCRKASDALFHQFDVKLNGVYDTQVADVLIRKLNSCGQIPRNVRSLQKCLNEYLGVQTKNLHTVTSTRNFFEDEQVAWKERPLPTDLQDLAVDHVTHLLTLHLTAKAKLMAEFNFGVDVYLSEIRDSKEEDIAVMSSELVPERFQSSRYSNKQKNHPEELGIFKRSLFKRNALLQHETSSLHKPFSRFEERKGSFESRQDRREHLIFDTQEEMNEKMDMKVENKSLGTKQNKLLMMPAGMLQPSFKHCDRHNLSK